MNAAAKMRQKWTTGSREGRKAQSEAGAGDKVKKRKEEKKSTNSAPGWCTISKK